MQRLRVNLVSSLSEDAFFGNIELKFIFARVVLTLFEESFDVLIVRLGSTLSKDAFDGIHNLPKLKLIFARVVLTLVEEPCNKLRVRLVLLLSKDTFGGIDNLSKLEIRLD